MALKATIFKAELAINDMDRHYYNSHSLTIARHPSETDERMMQRLVAFALFADEALSFGKGISTDDEPDLWLKNASAEIELWVDLGLPSLDRVRKACARAKQVVLIVYGSERSVAPWWKKLEASIQRFNHLRVLRVPAEQSQALTAMVKPGMNLQAMIQDGELWLSDDEHNMQIQTLELKS